MDKLKKYDIEFSGLKVGKHEFVFQIDESFFKLFGTELEFTDPLISIKIVLEKHSTFLEFWFEIKGKVKLVCDITTELFNYSIENKSKILVKFGEEYDDSNEEIITIPHTDYFFNVAQIIYELVILSIPMKKVSPNVKEEDLEFIEKFSSKESKQNVIEEIEKIDPRWEALKNLKK